MDGDETRREPNERGEIGDRCRRLCRRRRNFDSYQDRAPRRSSPPGWVEQQQTVSSPTCARWRRARAWRGRREKNSFFFQESIKKAKREKSDFLLASSRPLSSFRSLLFSATPSLSLRLFTVLGARERLNHVSRGSSIDVTSFFVL